LFRFYYSGLCSYLRTIIREREVIEEIVQGLFVYIWENRKTFSPKGNIKSYLFKAVRNRAINHIRNTNSRLNLTDEIKILYSADSNDIEEQYDSIELNRLISNSVTLLPEKCREIFTLIKFNGLSYKETAEILNLSVKTIETQMGRALKKLKESLLIYFN
jgi:RNA polymerase sigma-70 factor, ECF subfamily